MAAILLIASDGSIVSRVEHNSLDRPQVIVFDGTTFVWRGDDQRDGQWFRIYRQTDPVIMGSSSVRRITAVNPSDMHRYIELTQIITEESAKNVKPITIPHTNALTERVMLAMKIMDDIVAMYTRD